MENNFRWKIVSFAFASLFVLSGCSEEIVLRIHEEKDSFNAVLINNSDQRIEVVGGARLGIPPSFNSIQWRISSEKIEISQCVFADAEIRSVHLNPGQAHEMSLGKSFLERAFCISDGQPYEVRASYVYEGGVVYSNKLQTRTK